MKKINTTGRFSLIIIIKKKIPPIQDFLCVMDRISSSLAAAAAALSVQQFSPFLLMFHSIKPPQSLAKALIRIIPPHMPTAMSTTTATFVDHPMLVELDELDDGTCMQHLVDYHDDEVVGLDKISKLLNTYTQVMYKVEHELDQNHSDLILTSCKLWTALPCRNDWQPIGFEFC